MKVWTIRKRPFQMTFLLIVTILCLTSLIFTIEPSRDIALQARVIEIDSYHGDFVPIWEALNHKGSTNQDSSLLDKHIDNTINARPYNWTANANTPILTLFTTFKASETRKQFNEKTLHYWTALKPAVRPVLFSTPDDSDSFIALARELGWLVYPAPSLRLGIPILRDMFRFVLKYVTPASFFVGYANSDILFTDDLNHTLTYISHINWFKLNGQGLLLIGQRNDVMGDAIKMADNHIIADSDKVKTNSQPNKPYSLDYFITTANGYPIDSIPDFVVGKPMYDNWLVAKALEWQIRAIDCTNTITALHHVMQLPNNDRGWFSKNTCMNFDIAEPFAIHRGRTNCAPYFTQRHKGNGDESVIRLYQRLIFQKTCWNEPRNATFFHSMCEDLLRKKLVELEKQQNETEVIENNKR